MPEKQKSTGARLEHAQLSLDQVKQVQSEGNVPELNEGIIALRETLSLPQGVLLQDATAHVWDARIKLSQAVGGTRTIAADRSPKASAVVRTVQDGLIGDGASSRFDGGHHYLLKDWSGKDIPISLTQDMARNEGHALTISKDQ
jgi:hypothetical protein